jgi:hypothetical protein
LAARLHHPGAVAIWTWFARTQERQRIIHLTAGVDQIGQNYVSAAPFENEATLQGPQPGCYRIGGGEVETEFGAVGGELAGDRTRSTLATWDLLMTIDLRHSS